MKHLLSLFFFISLSIITNAQETTKPIRDTQIERTCSILDIEGKLYENVVVTLTSISADGFFTDKDRVKVVVKDSDGKKIYKKTFKNDYLYIYSSGQVQVGRPNFNKIVIYKNTHSFGYRGVIREREGVY